MEYPIKIGDTTLILKHDNLDKTINVDDLTTIDSSNIYGEATTISAATNRVGLLKAEVEALLATARLEEKVYIGKYIANKRKEASKNANKFFMKVGIETIEVKCTEKALETCYIDDAKYIELRKAYIQQLRNFSALDSLYWAMQDKGKKLNNLINKTTPEDFIAGLVQGKVNGINITIK